MLIRRPVIINGFARGGTNMLMNLLLSHPDLCSPGVEAHMVVRGGGIGENRLHALAKRARYDWPLRVVTGQRPFDPANLEPRRLSPAVRRWIDLIFVAEKARAHHPSHNLWKAPGVRYTTAERLRARLFLKSMWGTHFLSDVLCEMYPGTTVFCLVRNPYALAEGNLRRGMPLDELLRRFRVLFPKLLDDVERRDTHHLVRFESLVQDPRATLREVHRIAGLDPSRFHHVRMQEKAAVGADGKHTLREGRSDRELVWYPPEELDRHFRKDVNRNQLRKLEPRVLARLVDAIGDVASELGYEPPDSGERTTSRGK